MMYEQRERNYVQILQKIQVPSLICIVFFISTISYMNESILVHQYVNGFPIVSTTSTSTISTGPGRHQIPVLTVPVAKPTFALHLLPAQGNQLIAASSCIYDDICKQKRRKQQQQQQQQNEDMILIEQTQTTSSSSSKSKNTFPDRIVTMNDNSIYDNDDNDNDNDDNAGGWSRQQHRRETNDAIIDDEVYQQVVRTKKHPSFTTSKMSSTTRPSTTATMSLVQSSSNDIENTATSSDVSIPSSPSSSSSSFKLAATAKSIASRMFSGVLPLLHEDNYTPNGIYADDKIINSNNNNNNNNINQVHYMDTQYLTDSTSNYINDYDYDNDSTNSQLYPIVGFVYVKDAPHHSRPLPTISNPSCLLHYPNKDHPEELYGWFSPVCHLLLPPHTSTKTTTTTTTTTNADISLSE